MTLAPALVLVPSGRLLMGSSSGRPDEQPVHAVEMAAFRLGVTPVTHAQYALFLENGGAEAPPWWADPAFDAPDQPVVGVTWEDAGAFAQWLGRTHGGLWRLPTEAEWEWAARGGLVQAPTAWGDVLPADEVPEGPLEGPWPVGRGTPNGYGLFDMGTIVHEWCADRYAPYGAPAPEPEEGARRASRGGSWRHRVRWSPPSARSSLPPSSRYADYGFRVLCASG
jgi:sulfatase modifying factor 1